MQIEEKKKPKLIIHGGAGYQEGQAFTYKDYHLALVKIIKKVYFELVNYNARFAVLSAIRMLEDNPIFNAGTGSKFQKDGQIRMSAAIIDSIDNKFSGVINISNVRHPIDIANSLAKEKFTVLGGHEATEYARLQNVKYYNPATDHRLKEYRDELLGESGTVGALALDANGMICAGTSTGGVGFEIPGRIGDSATVAGTYANSKGAVSCTGKGEHIINQAAAAKIVTRIEDGISLQKAVNRVIKDANSYKYRFGLISLDYHGNMVIGSTKGIDVLYASHDGENIESFLKRIVI